MSEQHVRNQVMKAQNFAVEFEHILSNIFECIDSALKDN